MALKRAGEPANEVMVVEQSSPMVATNAVDVDAAVAQWEAYQEVTNRILDDTDYLEINGRQFKKKSAWRKYKRAFNVSTEIIEKNIVKLPNGHTQEAEFVVRATLPDGTFADGYGECHISERGWSKPNHDIPSTAQTRATNRAISDLIGAGEVSEEEINYDSSEETKETPVTEPDKAEPKKTKNKKTPAKKSKKVNEAIEVEAKDVEVVEG